ncbi:hypothetical protein E3J61_01495 [Candidatus Dependentiae bacterium]|nr:MAG: hypothetical protein E3J61_01495 [Candidatus Dependentiae bacterium]
MKKLLTFVLIVLFSAQNTNAQKPLSKKKHTITVKTNLSPKRGKVYLRVYPHAEEGKEDCKKIKQDLPLKGFKMITIPARCCWRELRIVEIGKKDKKGRVLGRVTAEEPLCMHGKTTLDISEGKKEKGMAIRPLVIKAQVSKKKKKK